MSIEVKRKPGWWLQELPEEERREMARKGGLHARNNPNTHRWKTGEQAAIDAGRKGGSVRKRTKSVVPLSYEEIETEIARLSEEERRQAYP